MSENLSARRRADLRFTALESERSTFIDHWRELSENIQPRRGQFLVEDNNKGTKKNSKIIDNTGTIAHRTLGAGMMTGLTSPSRPWFKLMPESPDMAEIEPVKDWLHDVEQILYNIFQQSNFYNAVMSIYLEAGLFGTSCLVAVPDVRTIVRFTPLTVGQYLLSIDDRGVVDTLYREIRMTVKQVVDKYGYSQCSTPVQNAWNRGNKDDWVTIRTAIEPNPDHKPDGLFARDRMPWVDRHWEKSSAEGDGFLRESGHEFFPAMCPRWHVNTGDIYGTGSPGMDALGDTKQLQKEQLRKGQAIDKMVSPPMKGPAALRSTQANTLPGGLTVVDGMSGADAFQPAYQVNVNLDHLLADIHDVRERINMAFYRDIFLMISQESDVRTATENLMRQEEKLLMLGPVLERLHDELLEPVVLQTYRIADEAGLLPEPPPEVQEQPLEVEFISMLAQAQRTVAVGGIERMSGFVASMAQINPNAIDKLNVDEAIDEYAHAIGASPNVIRSDDEVDEIRSERMQQEQAMQAAQQMQPAADALHKMSQVDTSGDNLVADVLGGARR